MSTASKQGKPRLGVYKFTSCDGCQLAFLNMGEELLLLARQVEFVHFAEMGLVAPDAAVDIAFVEGSISTAAELVRIRHIRQHARYLVSIGACATAGGIQALRNLEVGKDWLADVYATPETVDALATSTALRDHVKVDLELWGCPVSGPQVLAALQSLLFDVLPEVERDKVCMECKRQQLVCVLVAQGIPCMGPVTRSGCGALCPRFGRDCYGCYGPAEACNSGAFGRRLMGLGLVNREIAERFWFINSGATEFLEAGRQWDDDER